MVLKGTNYLLGIHHGTRLGQQSKKRNARKLLSQLFQSEANLIPQPERGLLRVQFLGLASDCTDRALLPLIVELNATRTQFPGTELTLFYELSPAGSFEN